MRYKVVLSLLFFTLNTAFALNVLSRDLEHRINAIRTMRADFTQTVMIKHRKARSTSGLIVLSRPGHLRWETYAPNKQILVADGKHFWIYDVDLEQVTVKAQQGSLGGIAGIFLSGYQRSLAQYFTVTASQQGANILFTLRAKSAQSGLREASLNFKQNILTSLQLIDNLGQRSIMKFNHIQVNVAIPLRQFQFKIPPGVDVVRQ